MEESEKFRIFFINKDRDSDDESGERERERERDREREREREFIESILCNRDEDMTWCGQ